MELTEQIIPSRGFTTLRWLADATPATAELLRLMDATPVPCGQSVITARRSDLFGWAGHGYCPSHSRWSGAPSCC